MSETSEKSRRETSPDTGKSTCSPGSGAGPSPSSSPGGATDLFGRQAAPVPSSPPRRDGPADAQGAVQKRLFGFLRTLAGQAAAVASRPGRPTKSTYGPKYGGSFASRSLQSSLENRLRKSKGLSGGPAFKLHWKSAVTLSGVRYCLLRASAPRTAGADDFLWPWTTPTAMEGNPEPNNPNQNVNVLGAQVRRLSGWPSPIHRDWKDTPGMSKEAVNPDGSNRSRLDTLPRTVGTISRLSSAMMEKEKNTDMYPRLNPKFGRWLMGFPKAWDRATPGYESWRLWQEVMDKTLEKRNATESALSGDTATPSSPKSRRRS